MPLASSIVLPSLSTSLKPSGSGSVGSSVPGDSVGSSVVDDSEMFETRFQANFLRNFSFIRL